MRELGHIVDIWHIYRSDTQTPVVEVSIHLVKCPHGQPSTTRWYYFDFFCMSVQVYAAAIPY